MKRKLLFISVVIIFLIAYFFVSRNFTLLTKTSISESDIVSVKYEKKSIKMSSKESGIIKKIFNNKELYDDPYVMCPFGYVSISFGSGMFSETFYPATDGCNTIKYKNKIFHISENNNQELRNILTSYGVKLPHV